MNLVWDLRPDVVTAPERLVLLSLADHSSIDGRNAFPSISRLARRTSLTRRAVQKILPRLRAKGFLQADGRMARGAVRYALSIETLDRERYSQTLPDHCEPDSQSAARRAVLDCEPDTHPGEPGSPVGANGVRSTCEPGSPDPLLIRPSEPSENQRALSRADVPIIQPEQAYEALKRAARSIQREQPDIDVEAHKDRLTRAARRDNIPHDDRHISAAVNWTRIERRATA